ncbi:hypothetical protein SAMN05421641_10110 [Paracoccus thiocyanatus]|uniref:DUF2946 domain-containing protein n=1 Tax=Paracoccus thiocyanatus TaxID=34006 RepID=A0A1N6N2P0_9RHOB|nr:DUF2946 family protein [Paracoccus thiocyanatus]SIP86289.1 hypothetical protein SAMN05421641_10110 [Paracoccus thiocyanatus]
MRVRNGYRAKGPERGALSRSWWRWLAVLPFLLFSAILPGTMVARDAQGTISVVLCSGDGPVQMAVAADGSLVPADETPHDGPHACDWSLHGQPLMPGAAAGGPLPAPQAAGLALWPEPAAAPPGLAAPAPLARGPPRFI